MQSLNCTQRFPLLKSFFAVVFFALAFFAKGQVTVTVTGNTNSTPNLATSYTSLANAITALSAVTAISGEVKLTCAAGSETSPVGGYVINFTAATTSTNKVIIETSGTVTITTPTQTAGNANDAIFKIIGSDWVTIKGFTMQENAANTTITPVGSNNMTEFGVALFYASTTNGPQNCTIENNTITLNRTYANSFGIYANVMHSATAMTTAATATGSGGGLNGLKIYGNTIQNVNNGIVVNGPTATADLNDGIDIGGVALSTANTITNYGNTGTFLTSYTGVSGTTYGVVVRNSKNVNVSYNTISTATGTNAPGVSTTRAIYIQAPSTVPVTGTHTITTSNNTIAIESKLASAAIQAIFVESGAAGASGSVVINSNTINNINHNVAASGAIIVLNVTGSATNGPLNTTINGNQFANTTSQSTGSFTFISNNFTRPANAVTTVNNNAIVTSFSKTGAGGTLQAYNSNSSSPTTASETNSNNNFSNITTTGATTISLWVSTDGSTTSPFGPTKTISNNTFNNITGGTSTTTILSVAYSNNATTNLVSGNTISNISASGGAITVTGILSAGGNQIFENNSISDFTCANTSSLNALTISGGSTQTVRKNRICNIQGTTTASIVTGINIAGGTTINISNNRIANLTAPSATSANAIMGMNLSATSTYAVYFNTILLNATSTSVTTFGTSCVQFSSTATSLDLRNNILVNLSTPAQEGSNLAANGQAVCLRRSAGTAAVVPTNYSTSSNNNLFWCNPTAGTNNHLTYAEGTTTLTNPQNTVGNLKTFMVNRDQSSVQENPTFTSTTCSNSSFLKINTSVATQIESAGASGTGITDDFEGDTRSGTPDIGADEGTFVGADLTGPSISYTVFTNTLCTTDRTLSATITDASSVNTTAGTKPRLYFKKSTDADNYVGNTSSDNGWKYVEATNSSSPFSFTTDFSLLQTAVTASDVIQYFIVAQDLAGTPNVGVNAGTFTTTPSSVALTSAAFPLTTIANSYTVLSGGLGSDVTIGAAGTYPTLTGAGGLFEALNSGGLTANISATIIDASVTETGATALNQINYGCAGSYTLTIKPQTTATLTGTLNTGAIIKLNGADNVIIDGSNSGGSDRSLTIRNNTTTTSGNAVIWLASVATNNGASNNVIKNCIIEGNSATTSFTGIHVGGSTTIGLTTAGVERNSNNTFNNNLFRKTIYGITLYGYGTSTPDLSNTVSNNNFGTSTSGEGFSLLAINAERQESLTVSGNEVQNVTNATNTSSTPFGGIRLIDVRSSLCFRNSIHDLAYSNTSTSKIYGIAITSSTYNTVGNPSNNQIYNNLVYKITSTGTSAVWNTTGILASAGYGDKYYFNSVHLTGQVANSSSGLVAAFANGDGNITSTCTNIDVRNNIFSLTGSSGTAGGNFWAYYTSATSLTGSTLNYNNLYCNGTNATNNIGRFNSTNYTVAGGLAAWQAATGQNANAIITDPQYNSTSNLKPLLGAPVLGTGIAGTGITIDYDNVTRGNPPSMGAYESGADAAGPTISYTNLANELVALSRTVTSFATITDVSGVNTTSGTKPRLYYKKSTDANAFVGNTSINNGWKYVEATNATSPFSFIIDYSIINGGSVSTSDVIQYFVVAQDLASSVNVGISSSLAFVGATPVTVDLQGQGVTSISGTPTSYSILASISGTITVPGTYPSLTLAGGAFEAINNGVVTGNINIEIAGDLTSETGLNALNAFNSPHTIKIYPTSAARLISGTASGTALIRLNGADRVTIDGSIGGTGTDRSLTITQSSSTANSANVFLASLGVGLGSTDNTIKNTVLVGASPTASSSVYGILIGGSTTATTSGNDNDNNTIQNNEIRNVGVGIFASGVSGNLMENTDFINNTIGNSVIGNSIGYAGLRLEYSNNTDITGNEIFNVVHSAQYDSDGQFGITAKNQSTNLTISKNKIYGLEYTGTSGYGAKGIQIRDLGSSSNTVISNNLVYDIDGDGWNDISVNDQTAGINLVGTQSNISIYNNSVYLGSGSFAGNTSGLISGALVIVNTGSTALDIRNNIFSSNLVNTAAGTAKTYAIYSVAPNTSFTNINNNNYYVSGSQGVLGFLTSDRTDLAGIVTGFGGNANSYNADPGFTSTTNLLPVANVFPSNYRLGTNISGITTDFAGTTRSNPPDIGAYEGADANRWIGATNTTWSTTTNWDNNTTPTSNQSITVAGNNLNNPILDADVTVNSLAINGASKVGIGSNTLTINGAVSTNGTGTITGSSTSSLSIGGSGALGTLNFDQTTDGSTNVLNNFTINRTTSGTVTLGNKLVVTGVLTPTDGTLTTGGFLHLRSNSTSTARVAALGATAAISGNVTVERYLQNKRAWRLLTSPQSSGSSIALSAGWQLQTHIVGPSGANLDATKPGYSMMTYNAGTQAWVGVQDPSLQEQIGTSTSTGSRAFAAFITGNRSVDLNNNSASSEVTLLPNASLLTGTQTVDLGSRAATDYVLVGNPYASPVDVNEVYLNGGTANINRTFYTWDPSLPGTGGYITISWNGSSYDIIPASAQTQHIQSGQAFFVQATAAATTTVVFEENDKSTSTVNTVFGVGNGNLDRLSINLQKIYNGNLSTIDGVMASFGATFSKQILATEDADKLFNNEEGITIRRNNKSLSIERRPYITNTNDTIFLALNRLQANTNYTLNLNPTGWDAGMQAYLVDKLLSTETAINLQSTSQDISITSTTANQPDRWMIVFRGSGSLPNNKLSLVATKKDRDVQLTWNIASEQGVKEYELQRSANGTDYSSINTQNATGKAEYNNTDTKANNGINYYRVKMTMLNDDVKYSNVVSINLKLQGNTPVTVYPNPIKGNIAQLQFNDLAAGNYTIKLIDMTGKMLQSQNIQHQGGTSSRSLSLGNIAAGSYQLVVEGKGFMHTISVLKSN